jgi:hypothetical protein
MVVVVFHPGHLSVLPPPSSWWVRGAVLVAALLVGVAVAIRWLHRPSSSDRWQPHVAAAVVVAVVFAGTVYVVQISTEHDYLSSLPAEAAGSDATLVADGHAACSWLGHHRWGTPPDLPKRWYRQHRRSGGARFAPFNPTEHVSNSTRSYYAWYINHIDAQQPGLLTAAERIKARVAPVAWLHMCHFQQWVHRPIGGGSGSD